MMVSLLLSDVEDRCEKRKEEIFALCAIKPRAFFASSFFKRLLSQNDVKETTPLNARKNERTNEIKSPRKHF